MSENVALPVGVRLTSVEKSMCICQFGIVTQRPHNPTHCSPVPLAYVFPVYSLYFGALATVLIKEVMVCLVELSS